MNHRERLLQFIDRPDAQVVDLLADDARIGIERLDYAEALRSKAGVLEDGATELSDTELADLVELRGGAR